MKKLRLKFDSIKTLDPQNSTLFPTESKALEFPLLFADPIVLKFDSSKSPAAIKSQIDIDPMFQPFRYESLPKISAAISIVLLCVLFLTSLLD